MEKLRASYVTEWGSGQTITTACQYDAETRTVSEIASVDVDGLDDLQREYVELADGTIIDTFDDDDTGRTIADGTAQDECDKRSALDIVNGVAASDV